MSTLTKEKAWIIFRADKLGYAEAQEAFKIMTKDQFDAYECHAEDFDFEIAKIGVEAQNEAAAIMEANEFEGLEFLKTKKPWEWTVMDYREVITPFKGSKFEKLHLSALFNVPNNELLLELVKP